MTLEVTQFVAMFLAAFYSAVALFYLMFAKLLKRKDLGLDRVEMTIITGENACRLCNGRGRRGCSTCATPSNVDGASDERVPAFLTEPSASASGSCPTCSGKRVVACEWCGGSGIRQA